MGSQKTNFESARIDFRKNPLPGARCVNVWMMHRLYDQEETMINRVYTLQITTALVRLVKPSWLYIYIHIYIYMYIYVNILIWSRSYNLESNKHDITYYLQTQVLKHFKAHSSTWYVHSPWPIVPYPCGVSTKIHPLKVPACTQNDRGFRSVRFKANTTLSLNMSLDTWSYQHIRRIKQV